MKTKYFNCSYFSKEGKIKNESEILEGKFDYSVHCQSFLKDENTSTSNKIVRVAKRRSRKLQSQDKLPSQIVLHSPMVSVTKEFLNTSLKLFLNVLPLINVEDVNLALDLYQNGKWEAYISRASQRNLYECACFTSFWACIAMGALVQGETYEAELSSMKAILASSMFDTVEIPLENNITRALFRAEMQLSRLFHVMGEREKSLSHSYSAEKLSQGVEVLQGCLKAWKVISTPVSQLFDSLHLFLLSDDAMDEFTVDTKIFFRWTVPFYQNLLFGIQDWDLKEQCYKELLFAENHLLSQVPTSCINWFRIQFVLVALEISYLDLFTRGAQRARELSHFIGSRYECKGVREFRFYMGAICLDFVAYILQKVTDAEHFEMIRMLWNSSPLTISGQEKPMSAMSEMSWDGFTDDILRNALRERVNLKHQLGSTSSEIFPLSSVHPFYEG